jgi:diguanylate cyclase (GGDEF)-like protein/PAS domain S-box-containing protein
MSFFAVFAVLIVVAAGWGTFAAHSAAQGSATAEATRDARYAADGAAAAISDALNQLTQGVVSTAASAAVLSSIDNPTGCTLSFGGVPPFAEGHLDFLGPAGSVRCSSEPDLEATYDVQQWLPATGDRVAVRGPIVDVGSGRTAIVVIAAVPGGAGYVTAFLDLDSLGPGLAHLFAGRRNVELMVTDGSSSHVLARSVDSAKWVGVPIAATAFEATRSAEVHDDLDGVSRIYASSQVPGRSWVVYAGANRAEALADAASDFRLLLLVVGAAALVMVCLFVTMYRRIVGPIRALYRETRAQRSGPEVTAIQINGPREISAVADEFNAVMRELSQSEQTYRVLFDGNPQPMWVCSQATGLFLTVNQAAIDHYGYSREEFLTMHIDDVFPAPDLDGRMTPELDQADRPPSADSGPLLQSGPWRHVKRSGDIINVEITSYNFTYLGEPGRFSIVVDITQRLEQERQLRHLALHDDLTGLANRTLILDRLATALGAAGGKPSAVAVLLMDLDRFKLVNEVHGHDAGDRLLTIVGERLAAGFRPIDSIARVGADEFVIVCPLTSGETEAISMASRIEGLLSHAVDMNGAEIFVTASVGISMSCVDNTAEDLVRNATTAMYRAKERGGDRFEIFDEGIRTRTLAKLATSNELHRAIARNELRLHYQPEIDFKNGVCNGFEALVRWEHPVRGLLAPAHFVELAEETGFIVQLGAWVLEAACEQAASWHASGCGAGSISVNLSTRELAQPSLVGQVSAALDRTGLDPGMLCLEITETSLMEDPDGAVAVLASLRDLGVKLSIDDFGTGYSSLLYLRRYKVDYLKVDRSFVAGLGSDAQATAIVSSVIQLAHALQLSVVAEGVETAEQADVLRAMNCDLGQGYLWSPPVPATLVPELCRRIPAEERYLATAFGR